MDLTSLLVQIVSDALGGSAAGAAAKQYSLGTLGNAIAGAIGGAIVGQLIGAVAGSAVEKAGSATLLVAPWVARSS